MSACKGCGKEIVWGMGPSGRAIPLDPSAPIYIVRRVVTGFTADKIERGGPGPQYLVSHFSTCPQANQFSGKNKEPKNAKNPL